MRDTGWTLTGVGIDLFRIKVILRGIDTFLQSGGKVTLTRAMNGGSLRRAVSEYTGKTYPRSERGLMLAQRDLISFLENKEREIGIAK